MTSHETIQDLLALSAAGLLNPAGERQVREHVRECDACAARLDALGALSAALGALPQPPIPAGLLARTQARLAEDADRRRGALLAAAAGVFGWVSMLATLYLCRLFLAGGVLPWLALYAAPAVLAAPAAAAVLVSGRRLERSFV